MVFLNQSQILGRFIPDVYISKIILQTRQDELRESNPHVDVSRESDLERDPRTGKLRPTFLSPRFENKPTDNVPLNVTVEFIIKERFEQDIFTSWFSNQDFAKYIKVKVHQVTDPQIGSAIARNPALIPALDSNTKPLLGTDEWDRRLVVLAREVGFLGPTSPELFDAKRDFPQFKLPNKFGRTVSQVQRVDNRILKLQKERISPEFRKRLRSKTLVGTFDFSALRDMVGDKENLRKHYREVDDEGREVYNILFKRSFTLPNRDPEYLAYYAYSYLDVQELARDFDLDLEFDKRGAIGAATIEIAVEDGRASDESIIYQDQAGKIWTGEIEYNSRTNTYFGVSTSGDLSPLNITTVTNAKVQDFRNVEELERRIIDFTKIEAELGRLKFINVRREKNGFQEPFGVFSEFSTARDTQGNVRFFFSLDYRRILENYSVLGKLFQREQNINQLVRESAIVNMRIFRRRVEGSPEAGSIERADAFFNEYPLGLGKNLKDVNIAFSGERTFGDFQLVDADDGALQEIVFALPNININSVRHFMGSDRTLRFETDGYYRYGVEIEIQDGGPSFVEAAIQRLGDAKLRMEGYLAEATSLGSSQNQVPVMDPHVDAPEENRIAKGEERRGSFDPSLNRFSQRFIDEQREKYYSTQGGARATTRTSPWAEASHVYIDVLRDFTESDVDFERISEQLLYFTHPTTGTPEGIRRVVDLMDKLQRDLAAAAGIRLQGSKGRSLQAVNSSRNGAIPTKGFNNVSKTKTFKLQHIFSDVINANLQPDVGFDFIDSGDITDNGQGLKVVSGGEWEKRVRRETNNYFITELPPFPRSDPRDSPFITGLGENEEEDAVERFVDRGVIDISFNGQSYTKGDSLQRTAFSYLSPAVIRLDRDEVIHRISNSPRPTFNAARYRSISIRSRFLKFAAFSSPSAVAKKANSNTLLKDFFERNSTMIKRLRYNRNDVIPAVDKKTENFSGRPQQSVDPLPEKQRRPCDIDIDQPDAEAAVSLLYELAKRTPITPNVEARPAPGVSPTAFKQPPVVPAIRVVEPPKVVRDTGNSPVFPPSIRTNTGKNVTIKRITPNLRSFDLRAPSNSLNALVRQPSLISSEYHFQGLSHNTTLNEAVSRLPNQIKGLYLQTIKPQICRVNYFLPVDFPIPSPPQRANIDFGRQAIEKLTDRINSLEESGRDVEFAFDYSLLKTVQVLRGYEKDDEGRTLLKKPLWEPLTIEIYNQSKGNLLLCRLRSYENKVLGIRRMSELELPTYDEHFFIRPPFGDVETLAEIAEREAEIERLRNEREGLSGQRLATLQREREERFRLDRLRRDRDRTRREAAERERRRLDEQRRLDENQRRRLVDIARRAALEEQRRVAELERKRRLELERQTERRRLAVEESLRQQRLREQARRDQERFNSRTEYETSRSPIREVSEVQRRNDRGGQRLSGRSRRGFSVR